MFLTYKATLNVVIYHFKCFEEIFQQFKVAQTCILTF